MNDVYDSNILSWSEQQAELLRRRAADALDWDDVAEEIEDLGRSELRAAESHLVQARSHDLKAMGWPESREVPHWRAEARMQRDDARVSFMVSMRQRIDVGKLWRRALKGPPDTIDERSSLPESCPVMLDDMLKEER